MNQDIRDKIEHILEEEVRPFLISHGGNVELIDVTPEKVVLVKLTGGCSGCPGSKMTLKGVIESIVKDRMPEIKSVESV